MSDISLHITVKEETDSCLRNVSENSWSLLLFFRREMENCMILFPENRTGRIFLNTFV